MQAMLYYMNLLSRDVLFNITIFFQLYAIAEKDTLDLRLIAFLFLWWEDAALRMFV